MVMMKLRIMENDQGGNNDNNDNDKENEIIQMKNTNSKQKTI